MKIRSAGLTDIGKVRAKNQDSLVCSDKTKIFAVADGMGGHKAGEVASEMAISTLKKAFTNAIHSFDPETYLTKVIQKANNDIYAKSDQTPSLKGMGTTLTCLYFSVDTVYVAHVGDSRAYLIQDDFIWQLSQDHSLVSEQMGGGAEMSGLKNVLTRSVGYDSQVQVDVYSKKIAKGDQFLLCSDGLHGFVKNTEMVQRISKKPLKKACKDLINLANERGGDDNITAVLVVVDEV